MALYALSQRTSATAAGSANWEIRTAATNAPLVMEMGLTQNAATAGAYGIGRPAAIGVTPTSPQNFVTEGHANAPTSITTACVAWEHPAHRARQLQPPHLMRRHHWRGLHLQFPAWVPDPRQQQRRVVDHCAGSGR